MSPRPIRWLWRLCNLAAEPGVRIARRINPLLRYNPRAATFVCYIFHTVPLRGGALGFACCLIPALIRIASMSVVPIVLIAAAAVLTGTAAVVIEELHSVRRRDVPRCPYCFEGHGNWGNGPGDWPAGHPGPGGLSMKLYDETAIDAEFRNLCGYSTEPQQ